MPSRNKQPQTKQLKDERRQLDKHAKETMKTTMQDIANYYNVSEDINTFDLECMIEEAGFISDCDTEWGICHNDTEKVIIDDNGKAIVTNL